MDNEVATKVFAAIKADNTKDFTGLVKSQSGVLSLCFGRFPVLSLMYLYMSKKLLMKYERKLFDINDYVYAEEPYEAYGKFAVVAKKSLRFYYASADVITPAEMLAAMGESEYLKCVYKLLRVSDDAKEKIGKIYAVNYKQNAVISAERIDVKPTKFSLFQKVVMTVAVVVTFCLMALASVGAFASEKLVGSGSLSSPVIIYNESQLRLALATEAGAYKLASDIVLTTDVMPRVFKGKVDGDGHTVYAGDYASHGLMTDLYGSIVNFNLVTEDDALPTASCIASGIVFENAKLSAVQISTGFGGTVTIDETTGRSALTPIVLSDEESLRKAIALGKYYYTLNEDITLTSAWQATSFSGVLNGNGHTIACGTYLVECFFSEMNGTLENLNFSVLDEENVFLPNRLLYSSAKGIFNVVTLAVNDHVYTADSTLGTEANPVFVQSEAQLRKALDCSGEYYKLKNDITLTSAWTSLNFYGMLDGNGYTVNCGKYLQVGFFDLLGGNLKDFVLSVTDENNEYLSNLLLFTTCKGKLTDVYLDVNGNRTEVDLTLGTADNPVKILSDRQLAKAVSVGLNYYILQNDINLTSEWTPYDFRGSIDGDGHTIFTNNHVPNGMFAELSGTLKNVVFDFGSAISADLSKSMAFVAYNNTGTVNNIKLKASGSINVSFVGEEVIMALGFVQNNGLIEGIHAEGNLQITGNGSGNAYFTTCVVLNFGSIKDASFSEGSSIVADTVDVCGLVVQNSGATMQNCVNKADITQTSSLDTWSPNASGVLLYNNGTLINSQNYGKITAHATSAGGTEAKIQYVGGVVQNNSYVINECSNFGDITVSNAESVAGSVGYVYVGGIAAINTYCLTKSKNDADITVTAKHSHVIIGGIAANINTGSILYPGYATECCSYGTLTSSITESKGDAYIMSGGICGVLYGAVNKSFTDMTAVSQSGAYLGAIVGGIFSGNPSGNIANNFYVGKPCYARGASTYYKIEANNVWSFEATTNGNGMTAVDSASQISPEEVYWE